MPTVNEIRNRCLVWAPQEWKEEWDNVGLLCGRSDTEVTRVLVALDVTRAVAKEAVAFGAELIVSHHPLLFSVSNLSDETPEGALLLYLVQHGISVISLHTNLDSAPGGVNDVLARQLDLENVHTFDGSEYGIGRVGDVAEQTLVHFVQFVKDRLSAPGIRYADGGKQVRRVAVGGGSCMDYLPQALAAGCDTFVTGDVKYHQFQKAAALGVNLIDAGHFPTEDPVCNVLCDYLLGQFPEIEVKKSEIHGDCVKFA